MTIRERLALLGALALLVAPAGPARAGYLDPMAFGSLGVLDLAAGDYTIETDGAPVLRDSSNNILFTGTTYFQGGTFGSTVSVLAFDTINVAAGVSIRVVGENPLALLSRTDAVIGGLVDASGSAGQDSARFGGNGAGGAGGPGAGKGGDWAQAGGGPGGGPAGPPGIGVVQAAGGSFGGHGGQSAFGTRGPTYGDLNLLLQGGSGGGGTGGSFFDGANGAGGGGGGGAVELGASGSISFVGGDLIANGGGVGAAFAANAGGGSGGGLLIHAPTIDIDLVSTIQARGGSFFGGGGRILFLTDTATVGGFTNGVSVDQGGGANNQEPGVIEFGYLRPAAVPEPSTLAMMGMGGLAVAGWARGRRR